MGDPAAAGDHGSSVRAWHSYDWEVLLLMSELCAFSFDFCQCQLGFCILTPLALVRCHWPDSFRHEAGLSAAMSVHNSRVAQEVIAGRQSAGRYFVRSGLVRKDKLIGFVPAGCHPQLGFMQLRTTFCLSSR